ncbi:MAG: dTDP-4-amino-4,6-dideoxygalactose transaminase [Bacteroidaceae bacterium]
MIPFNKPHLTGYEIKFLNQCLRLGKLSGNGDFTKKCEQFFEKKIGALKCLLTTSCTDALEMCAILADIKPDDEVIVPSYTFVSSALAFVRQGATIIYADSMKNSPDIDVDKIEPIITPKTKAIVVVHYGGIACDMDKIMALADKYHLIVIEDAAQSIDSFYKGRPLGSIGHLAAFSFHETKNIQCGEGGLLAINDKRFIKRSEIIWEKGTNRAEFFRGEINKYGWVDTGSSFLPTEYVAAFLWGQLQCFDQIQSRRKDIWNRYYDGLKDIRNIEVAQIPDYATNNAHLFYLICASLDKRTQLISFLKEKGITANFHYLSLHKSDYMKFKEIKEETRELPMADKYTSCLVRLPLYYDLNNEKIDYIISQVKAFYSEHK